MGQLALTQNQNLALFTPNRQKFAVPYKATLAPSPRVSQFHPVIPLSLRNLRAF